MGVHGDGETGVQLMCKWLRDFENGWMMMIFMVNPPLKDGSVGGVGEPIFLKLMNDKFHHMRKWKWLFVNCCECKSPIFTAVNVKSFAKKGQICRARECWKLVIFNLISYI
jgi:hypothetical protein